MTEFVLLVATLSLPFHFRLLSAHCLFACFIDGLPSVLSVDLAGVVGAGRWSDRGKKKLDRNVDCSTSSKHILNYVRGAELSVFCELTLGRYFRIPIFHPLYSSHLPECC